MIVPTQTTVALRCPQCGKLEFHPVSVFDLGGSRSLRTNCSCGAHKFTVGRQASRVWLQFPCILCEEMHFAYYSRAEFWSPEPKAIDCPTSQLDVGFLGVEEEVRNSYDAGVREAERLLRESGLEDFFDNSEVMYVALNRVYDLLHHDKVSCPCGGHNLKVEIFPERVEIHCHDCGRFRPIPAARERDLERLEELAQKPAGKTGWRKARPRHHHGE